MKIYGFAFDLEGTAVDVEMAHHLGHIAAAAEFGLTISLEQAYNKVPHFIGGPDEKVCEDIWHLLGSKTRTLVTVNEILARDKFHYERLLTEMPIEPRPGFLGFCIKASSMGIMRTVGSLTSEKQAVMLLKNSGLAGEFFRKENIVLREHVARLKPAPDVFLKTASIMGIKPCEQLVFEDSPLGVQAALAAGSKAVGMPVVIRGTTVGALVDAGACRIFFDWREINIRALIDNLGQ